MIARVYIQHTNGRLEPDHSVLYEALLTRNLEFIFFTIDELRNHELILNKNTAFVGELAALELVFGQIGYHSGKVCYPDSLRPYLKRKIWETTVGAFLEKSENEDVSDTFIKPKYDIKLFYGFVLEDHDDLDIIEDLAPETVLYCSEVVSWYSEYRVFVNQGQIVGVQHYRGDAKTSLNMEVVNEAIQTLENSGEASVAYGIDFGVLLSGETALIEWNDSLGLGHWGLPPQIYADLFLTRWESLLEEAGSTN